jgi:hypothetical protein
MAIASTPSLNLQAVRPFSGHKQLVDIRRSIPLVFGRCASGAVAERLVLRTAASAQRVMLTRRPRPRSVFSSTRLSHDGDRPSIR